MLADKAYATAERLIAKYGSDVQVEGHSHNHYDPATGDVSGDIDAYQTKAFLSNIHNSDIIEGVIDIDDLKALFAFTALGEGDTVLIHGAPHHVVKIIDMIETQNRPIIFTAILRKHP